MAAVLTMRAGTVMRSLVRRFTLKKGQNQIDLNVMGQITTAALTDGVDLANPQNFRPTRNTFTASEAGSLATITDKAMREALDDVIADLGEEQGGSMAEYYDTQLFSNFDTFTSLGGAGTEITPKYVLAGRALLSGNSTQPIPPTGKISAVIHTYQGYEFQNAQTFPGTSNVPLVRQNSFATRFLIAQIFDLGVYHSPSLTVDGSDDAKGAVFHEKCMVLVEEKRPGVEFERDASLRATESVMVADFGNGIHEAEWGTELYFDAAAPSGTTI
jgi:hypothetical protein